MIRFIALDTGPLGLLTQRRGIAPADDCRAWLDAHIKMGVRVLLPEIADYELRRELLRLTKIASVRRLDAILINPDVDYLPLTTPSMRKAAELWTEVRRRGMPTADPHAIDGDVILAAQVLTAGLATDEDVVATTNVGHLSRFLDARAWDQIV